VPGVVGVVVVGPSEHPPVKRRVFGQLNADDGGRNARQQHRTNRHGSLAPASPHPLTLNSSRKSEIYFLAIVMCPSCNRLVIRSFILSFIHSYIHTYIHTYIYIYIQAYVYVCMHAHTHYILTYIYTNASQSFFNHGTLTENHSPNSALHLYIKFTYDAICHWSPSSLIL